MSTDRDGESQVGRRHQGDVDLDPDTGVGIDLVWGVRRFVR